MPTAFAVDSSNPAWLDTVIGNSEQKEKGKNESGAQFIKQLLSGRGLSFNEGTRPGTVMELLSTEHAGELLASFPTADSYTPTEYAKKRTTDAIGVVLMCACDDAWVQIKTDSVKQKLGDSSRPQEQVPRVRLGHVLPSPLLGGKEPRRCRHLAPKRCCSGGNNHHHPVQGGCARARRV